MAKSSTPLKIGMIVFPKGLITPQLYRVSDMMDNIADLKPISLGAVPMKSPAHDLRRYRIRHTDEASWEDHLVKVVRCLNPLDTEVYRYEVEAGDRTVEVPEYELSVHEGSMAPDTADMLSQFDLAPWKLVSARACLLESFFNATERSMGIVGYNGARMLPIPHQINAARYALQFGRPRFLLADEVGLGKTVEAGLILSTLKKYFPDWTTSIFVPESLTAQWAFEMYGKFGKLIFDLDEEEYDEDSTGIILPHERARSFAIRNEPNILVVDEAHRILHDERLVQAFIRLSKKAHAVLLLTATPVSDDAMNLLRLFQVLDPKLYGHLKKPGEMQSLQEREARIEKMLKAIRQPRPHIEDVRMLWDEVDIDDEEIQELLSQGDDDRAGRHKLHRVASLVVDRYYPGARMLRYRRKFLEEEVALPFRIVDPVEYKPTTEESTAVDLSREWLDLLKKEKLSENISAQRVAAALIQAAHSSPLALGDWVEARQGTLERHEGVTADPILLSLRAMEELGDLPGEEDVLERMGKAAEKWKRASRAIDATLRQLARSGRFQAFLAFLKTTFKDDPDSHVLVFTSFESNVHPLYLLLRKALGDDAEVFEMTALQPRVEREKNSFEFQEFLGGSVLISDELGGEGRNFQFATHVVHFDLPFAPWMVEQRIGRCDRVGRSEEMDVDSQVLVAKGQLDEALFDFLADGVGVFNESIAPVESELDRIVFRALKFCIDEGATGVLDLIDETAEYLEEARERENAALLVRDAVGVEEAQRISSELKDDYELEELKKYSLGYASLFESMVDEQKDGRVSATVGEFHSLHGMPGILSEMIGYFNREKAVRHERLEFFSPGHPLVRTMARLAMIESPDRAAVIRRKGLEEPALLCTFRISIPPDFFDSVRGLPIDIQPPLLSKSARLFATRMQRLAVNLDGGLIDQEESPLAYRGEFIKGDKSLEGAPELAEDLGEAWDAKARGLVWSALEALEEEIEKTLPQRLEEFEDLVCEVFTRVHPSHELSEPEIATVLRHFQTLHVDLESAVFMLPEK